MKVKHTSGNYRILQIENTFTPQSKYLFFWVNYTTWKGTVVRFQGNTGLESAQRFLRVRNSAKNTPREKVQVIVHPFEP